MHVLSIHEWSLTLRELIFPALVHSMAGDQLELFAEQEMPRVWRTRDEIEANLERREALTLPRP